MNFFWKHSVDIGRQDNLEIVQNVELFSNRVCTITLEELLIFFPYFVRASSADADNYSNLPFSNIHFAFRQRAYSYSHPFEDASRIWSLTILLSGQITIKPQACALTIALRPISKNRFQSVRPSARLRQTNIPSLPFLYIMSSKTSTSSLVLTTLTENDNVPGSRFEHDPSEYTVEQLKRWLKCRGLKQSGK